MLAWVCHVTWNPADGWRKVELPYGRLEVLHVTFPASIAQGQARTTKHHQDDETATSASLSAVQHNTHIVPPQYLLTVFRPGSNVAIKHLHSFVRLSLTLALSPHSPVTASDSVCLAPIPQPASSLAAIIEFNKLKLTRRLADHSIPEKRKSTPRRLPTSSYQLSGANPHHLADHTRALCHATRLNHHAD